MSITIRRSRPWGAVREHGLGLLAIAVIAMAVYLNALPSAFVWDDQWLIEDNTGIRDLRNIPKFFAPRYWQQFQEEYFRDFPGRRYRPVPEISFALDYSIWGLNRVGFHLGNVLMHIANCVLGYALTYRVFGHKRIALFAMLLFAVHPLHTEAVVWVKVRSQLLGLTFMLASVLLYARHMDRPAGRWSVALYTGSLASFGLAILCKATALILPALLILYACCFVPRRRWRTVAFGMLPFAAVILAFLAIDPLMPVMPRARMAPVTYVASVFVVLGQYTQFFLAPVNLCLHRYWHMHPRAADIYRALAPTAPLVLALMVGAVVALRRSRAAFFALGWFVVALGPAFRVAFMGRPVAESRIYGPSLGLCMLFGFLLHRLAELHPAGGSTRLGARIAAALCVLVLAVCSGLTIARNADWSDNFRLWLDTAQKNPQSWHAQVRVARFYYHAGDLEKALEHMKIASELRPGDTEALRQLGEICEQLGRPNDAIRYYRDLLDTDNENVNARMRLGVLYANQGNTQRAEWYFRSAVALAPRSADAHRNLAAFYANSRQYAKAIPAFQQALRLAPNDATVHQDLGAAYAAAELVQQAVSEYRASLAIDPKRPEAWLSLGVCYQHLGDRTAAIAAYRQCLPLGGPAAEMAAARLAELGAQPGR